MCHMKTMKRRRQSNDLENNALKGTRCVLVPRRSFAQFSPFYSDAREIKLDERDSRRGGCVRGTREISWKRHREEKLTKSPVKRNARRREKLLRDSP